MTILCKVLSLIVISAARVLSGKRIIMLSGSALGVDETQAVSARIGFRDENTRW